MDQPSAPATPESPLSQLPDELWALVLSKFTWWYAWRQAKLLLCWKPGAAHALQEQPQLLAQLLTGSSDDSSKALRSAAKQGRLDVATLLLAQHTGGAASLAPALSAAAGEGHGSMVTLLLDHCYSNNSGDSSSIQAALNRAFHSAAQNGRTTVALQLLDAGAEVNSNYGEVLVWVAGNGHHETVRALLNRSADVHANTDQAIFVAAYYGHAHVVEVLLDAGTDPSAVFLDYVAREGHDRVLQLLLRRGVQLDAAREKELLRAASAAGRHSTVQLLLGRRVRTRAEARRLAALLQ